LLDPFHKLWLINKGDHYVFGNPWLTLYTLILDKTSSLPCYDIYIGRDKIATISNEEESQQLVDELYLEQLKIKSRHTIISKWAMDSGLDFTLANLGFVKVEGVIYGFVLNKNQMYGNCYVGTFHGKTFLSDSLDTVFENLFSYIKECLGHLRLEKLYKKDN
jgi:hypothetical protein